MSAKKFEKLIALVINEDQAKAEALFHDIIVEKSREIYESIMAEDQVGGFMDEIEAEETGEMMEADEEEFETGEEIDGDFDVEGGDDMDDEDMDFGDEEDFSDEEDFGDEEGGDEGLEDRVVDLEDKLDQLMADFEAEMGGSDMGDDEDMDDMDDEEFDAEEDEVMESVEMKKVSVTHGDNGVQTKSAGLQNPKRIQTGGAPVKFAGESETVPAKAQAPSNAYSKGQKEDSAGNINTVGANAGKTAFKTKAPAPKTETTKARSPVPESKKSTKSRI
jgi:hypothetical protein